MDRDDALALISFGEPEVRELLPGVRYAVIKQHWHIVTPDGEDLIEGAAGIVLLELLKPTRWVGKALRALRAERLLTPIDRFIARYRKKAKRWVKDGERPRRYP
jgi:hypothetical protein